MAGVLQSGGPARNYVPPAMVVEKEVKFGVVGLGRGTGFVKY